MKLKKELIKRANGTVFKSIVRGVVKEEIEKAGKRLEEKLDERLELTEERLDRKLDATFSKYRDETLTKMDEVVGELKAIREEQVAHFGLYRRVDERVESLESIHPHGHHSK